MNNLPKVIFLMGPTASGKTELAKKLIQRLSLEIVSVDSAMIYHDMDIGTGKPSKQELETSPHHLIDILDPSQAYSAAQFRLDSLELIQQIHQRNNIPLFVGGTMLYFKALKQGISDLPHANPEIRERLQQQKESFGLDYLHQKLKEIDPVAAARIHPNDPQRLLRALEVYAITGKPMSELLGVKTELVAKYDLLEITIAPIAREILHQHIVKRFEKMLQLGFVNEVKKLQRRGDLNLDKPAMRAVGYRQVWEYLNNHYDYAQMKEKAIIATRQLAKRQLTWLRSWNDLMWFDSEDPLLYDKVHDLLLNFISQDK